MVREKCLKKSFKDSLENIKERMKEKRNKKWAKLGKPNQIISAKSKIADNSSTYLKSFQANNRALALALEEERSKMREAQDIILHLKKEYQYLKFQMFVLQRKHELQKKQHAETKLVALKKIISKVVQNLLDASNLLDPAQDLHTPELNQNLCISVHENCESSSLRTKDSMLRLKHVPTENVNKQGETSKIEVENNEEKGCPDFVSDSWQGVENTPAIIPQIDIDWQSNSHENQLAREIGSIYSDEEDMEADNPLPRSVSTRRHRFKIKTQNELNIVDGRHLETTLIKNICQQNRTKPQTSLEKDSKQCEEMYLGKENKHDVNADQTSGQFNILAESNTSIANPKQADLNSIESLKTKSKRGQKRKVEVVKNLSRSRSKKERSQNKKSCSAEKTSSSVGSSDAYDFTFEESVHVTPFRPNKENENNRDDNKSVEETETYNSDSFISVEDSDDSLYIPYTKKSKSRKSLSSGSDVNPVHTRPQLRKDMFEQPERDTEGKIGNRKQSAKSMGGEPSGTVQKSQLHLGDITNLVLSSSTKTRASHPVINKDKKDTPHCRRLCTLSVNYKEPSLTGKLRRGDPFTDTCFLNSPIFKNKTSKHRL